MITKIILEDEYLDKDYDKFISSLKFFNGKVIDLTVSKRLNEYSSSVLFAEKGITVSFNNNQIIFTGNGIEGKEYSKVNVNKENIKYVTVIYPRSEISFMMKNNIKYRFLIYTPRDVVNNKDTRFIRKLLNVSLS